MHTCRSALLALSLVLPWSTVPASAAEIQVDGIPHAALFAVDFDGAHGVAVGAGGQVMRTRDGGAQWQAETAGEGLALLGVAVHGERSIAVGQMGLILVKDGDGPWQAVESGTTERLFDVDLNSRGEAIAVGAFGALLRSGDGGRTWRDAAPEWEGMFNDPTGRLGLFEPSLYGVHLNDRGEALVAGELSLILRSESSGAEWTVINAGTSTDAGVDPTIFDLQLRADGTGYAVGQEGLVLQTRDRGLSWRRLALPSNANLLAVSSTADGQVVIAGLRDMLSSGNEGQAWQRVEGADIATGWYSGVFRHAESRTTYSVGNAGRILRIDG